MLYYCSSLTSAKALQEEYMGMAVIASGRSAIWPQK